MEAYEDGVLQYQDDMEVWQDEYQEWKENRANAIGIVREKYSDAFDVNIASHWGWVIFMMIMNSGLIFSIMKWKDRRRLSMKPGITCLWQINGRSTVAFDRWMELDKEYIDNWSLWLDFKILAKTVPAVMRGTGAS